jgi:sialate O-acetylesterase
VQLAVATSISGVGLAVTTDLGNPDDVHPLRKREVGERLAAATLATAYGRPGGGGPLFTTAVPEAAAMRVTFSHISGGGLELRRGEPSGFALAGADKVWHHASAKLDGASVLVTSSEVSAPVAVRYGWADCPPSTLFDRAGFAAMAFRSDH